MNWNRCGGRSVGRARRGCCVGHRRIGPTEDDLTRQALATSWGSDSNGMKSPSSRSGTTSRAGNAPCRSRTSPRPCSPSGAYLSRTPADRPGDPGAVETGGGLRHARRPREMKAMYDRMSCPSFCRRLAGRHPGRTIQTFGAGESEVGDRIRDLMGRGRNPTVGTTASQAIIGVRIHAHAPAALRLKPCSKPRRSR